MEELIEDTFESMEDDDLEEDADREIEKILFEVTKGMSQQKHTFNFYFVPFRPTGQCWRNWH